MLVPTALAAPASVQVGVCPPLGVTLTWAGRRQLPAPHRAVQRGQETPPPHPPCSKSSKADFYFLHFTSNYLTNIGVSLLIAGIPEDIVNTHSACCRGEQAGSRFRAATGS